jgi:uncharacterized membrane protein YfcA
MPLPASGVERAVATLTPIIGQPAARTSAVAREWDTLAYLAVAVVLPALLWAVHGGPKMAWAVVAAASAAAVPAGILAGYLSKLAGRLASEHLTACLGYPIRITGTTARVAPWQKRIAAAELVHADRVSLAADVGVDFAISRVMTDAVNQQRRWAIIQALLGMTAGIITGAALATTLSDGRGGVAFGLFLLSVAAWTFGMPRALRGLRHARLDSLRTDLEAELRPVASGTPV